MNDKIIFDHYDRGYRIYYVDSAGEEKYLGKVRHDLLPTAMWFYRLEVIDTEIGDSNAGISS
jgi:hypothetical protein